MATKRNSENEDQVSKRLETLNLAEGKFRTILTNKYKRRQGWTIPDKGRVVAIIPGTVRKVMISEGDIAAKGTPLLILEAMKMYNQIFAPFDGKVNKLHVKVGQVVSKNAPLVEMEEIIIQDPEE